MISKVKKSQSREFFTKESLKSISQTITSDRMMHLKIEILLLLLDILKENTHPLNIFSLKFYFLQTRDKYSVKLRLFQFHFTLQIPVRNV